MFESSLLSIKFKMKPLLLDCNGARALVASFAAVVCVGPTLPPHQRLLNRAGHSIPRN